MAESTRPIPIRRFESVIRTLFYAGLVVGLYLGSRHSSPTLAGAVVGVTLADYLTWLVMAFIDLPEYIAEGVWDALINFAASIAIYSFCGMAVPRETEGIVLGFLAFLAVLALKGTYYGLKVVVTDEE